VSLTRSGPGDNHGECPDRADVFNAVAVAEHSIDVHNASPAASNGGVRGESAGGDRPQKPGVNVDGGAPQSVVHGGLGGGTHRSVDQGEGHSSVEDTMRVEVLWADLDGGGRAVGMGVYGEPDEIAEREGHILIGHVATITATTGPARMMTPPGAHRVGRAVVNR